MPTESSDESLKIKTKWPFIGPSGQNRKVGYYGQYFKGVCDLAIALGFAPEDIEIIVPKAWHYVNKEL